MSQFALIFQPEGLAAISRRSPKAHRRNLNETFLHPGGMPASEALASLRDAEGSVFTIGGIAALNHRLMAVNPSGSYFRNNRIAQLQNLRFEWPFEALKCPIALILAFDDRSTE